MNHFKCADNSTDTIQINNNNVTKDGLQKPITQRKNKQYKISNANKEGGLNLQILANSMKIEWLNNRTIAFKKLKFFTFSTGWILMIPMICLANPSAEGL